MLKKYFSTAAQSTKILPVRVRYAPSPTGNLHIGGLRTALYNYLFAKRMDGKFILRVEDTDKNREVKESIDSIIKGMKWAGLTWDEGPGSDDNTSFGPYFQSQRLDLYRKYAHKLVENGDAYYCFCHADRLQHLREEQEKKKIQPKYDGHCLKLTETEVYSRLKSGEPHVIRLRVPSGGTIQVSDLIKGNVTFNSSQIDDQVLLKTDGYPTYHLANVIDDYHMKISHVIRGEEWLTSLPKHVLLYKALDFKMPKFAHIPLILSPTGGKLSKRHSHTSVDHYMTNDYVPEAVTNFIALLGWRPSSEEMGEEDSKNEIMKLSKMIENFDIKNISASNAKLDEKKLLFFNSHFLKLKYNSLYSASSPVFYEFKEKLIKYLPECKKEIEEFDNNRMIDFIKLSIERIKSYQELAEMKFFFQIPDYNSESSIKSQSKIITSIDKSKNILNEVSNILAKIEDGQFNLKEISQVLSEYHFKNKNVITHEDLYQLLRIVVTGSHSGVSVTKSIEILGKKEFIKRMTVFSYNRLR